MTASTSGDGTASGDHLSIGEVLAALSDEFPDITISKIRFLESQGLIDPERTPSGYRKFYADDLARLRWILFQQKEHFLPLKVIKERLDQMDPSELAVFEPAGGGDPSLALDPGLDPDDVIVHTTAEVVELQIIEQVVAAAPARTPASGRAAARTKAPRRNPAFAPTLPLDTDASADAEVVAPSGDVEQLYTRAALASAAGIETEQVADLEQFGLITPARESGNDVQFDADALETAIIAARFFARGVQARHLRMYRTSAEREAALFGQVLLPYVRQRNPESRDRLQQELIELAGLGRQLRSVLLREAVRDTLAE
ncbi:MAG: MerR family transcriptional regulator [Acidimicrobiia bacterium]